MRWNNIFVYILSNKMANVKQTLCHRLIIQHYFLQPNYFAVKLYIIIDNIYIIYNNI